MQVDGRKYYIRGVLLPAAVVVALHFILYIINENQSTPGYESEYFTESAINGITFVFVLVHTIFILFLCSPILLMDLTHKRTVARFLWWFLLPGSWLLYLSWNAVSVVIRYEDHASELWYTFSNVIPYGTGLIWSYVKYNQELATLKEELPGLDIITKEDRKIPQSHTPPARMGGA